MRFLKNRIAQAKAFQSQNPRKAPSLERSSYFENQTPKEFLSGPKQILNNQDHGKEKQNKKRRPPGSCTNIPETSRETKNLVKNYGKAICNFSTSPIAMPYLSKFVEKERGNLEGFLNFVKRSKNKIDGLTHFREILLSNENDDEIVTAYRRIYKEIGTVFIKFFSVNWIFNSKIRYKKAHLEFRFKMLRRIRSPELFTYLKGPRILTDLS